MKRKLVVASVLVFGVCATGAFAGSASQVAFSTLPNHGIRPRAIPQHLWRLARELTLPDNHFVWLVPTPNGNFCEGFSYGFGGCRGRTFPPSFSATQRAAFRIEANGVGRNSTIVAIGGDLLAAPGSSVTVVYADGSHQRIPVTFVSAPISAGFYALTLSRLHQKAGHTPIRVDAADPTGKLIGSVKFTR